MRVACWGHAERAAAVAIRRPGGLLLAGGRGRPGRRERAPVGGRVEGDRRAARLRLLSLVAGQPGGEACICDLIEPVALSQPTVSHHMKVLVEAGLLEREQRGKWAYFRLVPGTLDTLARLVSTFARPA